MATGIALVPPRPWVVDLPGLCLRYAQSFYGAPARHRSARDAFDATQFKHSPDEPLPDVPVLLWFDHWGAYNDGLGPYRGVPVGGVANWGHVTPLIPGQGIYSSPANPRAGETFDVYSTIAEVERAFNASYIGWTEDINGLRVAQIDTAPPVPPRKGHLMIFDIYFTGPTTTQTGKNARILLPHGSFHIPTTQVLGLLARRRNAILKAVTGEYADNMLDAEHAIINSFLRSCFVSSQTGIELDPGKLRAALTDALKAAGTSFTVDVDAEIPVDDLAAAFEQASERIAAALVTQAGKKLTA